MEGLAGGGTAWDEVDAAECVIGPCCSSCYRASARPAAPVCQGVLSPGMTRSIIRVSAASPSIIRRLAPVPLRITGWEIPVHRMRQMAHQSPDASRPTAHEAVGRVVRADGSSIWTG